MPIEVKMAKLSPTMESGQLVKWLVKVGDPIKEGDALAEIQTDKAVMTMESFDEGTIALLDVNEGDDVQLGQRMLVIAKKGEDAKQAAASMGGGATAKQAVKAPAGAAEANNAQAAPQSDAASNGQDSHAPEPVVASVGEGRVKSTPLARKVAAEAKIQIAQVTGSGPNGRVVRDDVEAFLKKGPSTSAPAPSARPSTAPAPRAPGATERQPLNRMRQAIARGMLEAKKAAPEIHVTVDIKVDEIVKLRERLNKALAAEKVKLSVGDFVTKAVAVALRRHPAVNATFEGSNDKLGESAIVRHSDVNVGLAVALDGGLIVPVLRNADTLGLRDIRTGSETLYDAARQMKLTGDQMNGGTFTISNLGMYGVKQFDAILNLPQVGILAVGAAEKRPVVVGDALAVATVMTVTLTADHRAVDGATAAEFLRTLKGLLEEPASMLL
ncbi:dihydrolipoamide acetyltransferase family protein [Isosphaeraceae bacterium EP7]